MKNILLVTISALSFGCDGWSYASSNETSFTNHLSKNIHESDITHSIAGNLAAKKQSSCSRHHHGHCSKCPKGPTGPQGPRGEKGATGPTGPRGATGAAGSSIAASGGFIYADLNAGHSITISSKSNILATQGINYHTHFDTFFGEGLSSNNDIFNPGIIINKHGIYQITYGTSVAPLGSNLHLADIQNGLPGDVLTGSRVPVSDLAWQSTVITKELHEGQIVALIADQSVTLSTNGSSTSILEPTTLAYINIVQLSELP